MKGALIALLLLSGIVVVSRSTSEACRPLVVVGMEHERAIAAGDDVDVVVGAANARLLRERLGRLDTARISAVYSFGVAGGLDPALKPGSLLVSTRVVAQDTGAGRTLETGSWAADPELLSATLQRAVNARSLAIRTGIFLGTDVEARDNDNTTLHKLRKTSGAVIIDNESHLAAQFAADHGLPFLSVRVVSDSIHKALPPAALVALNEDGSADGAAVAKSILRRPWQIPALIRTAVEYGRALNALRDFRREIGFPAPRRCGDQPA